MLSEIFRREFNVYGAFSVCRQSQGVQNSVAFGTSSGVHKDQPHAPGGISSELQCFSYVAVPSLTGIRKIERDN